MMIFVYLAAGLICPVSIIAHIYVKIRLRPRDGSDFDDCYHEFEDEHPDLIRYEKWSRITFVAAVASSLVLFLSVVF